MNTLTTTALTAALSAALALPAHAGRPLVTEDAGVLARGDCELEGAVLHASESGASAIERSLQLGCGIGMETQLAVNVATAKVDRAREQGLALVGKTSLWQSDATAALSLAWSFGWTRPAGDSWQHAATQLTLVYSRPLWADTTLHANLGHERDRSADVRSTQWGLALEHAGAGGVAPMAELFGDDRGAPWWNLGVRWAAMPEKLFVDASYGQQFASGKPRLVTLGFKFAF